MQARASAAARVRTTEAGRCTHPTSTSATGTRRRSRSLARSGRSRRSAYSVSNVDYAGWRRHSLIFVCFSTEDKFLRYKRFFSGCKAFFYQGYISLLAPQTCTPGEVTPASSRRAHPSGTRSILSRARSPGPGQHRRVAGSEHLPLGQRQ